MPRHMGVGGSFSGIQNRVYFPPTEALPAEGHASSLQWSSEGGAFVRNRCPSGQGGYYPGFPPLFGGFLVQLFPGTKENRGLAPHSEPQAPEQVYQAQEVQNGDISLCSSLPHQRYLGNVDRPEGRLSSCPNSTRGPEVAPIQSAGTVLPVQLPSLRAVDCPSSVYEGGQGSGCVPEKTRDQPVCVPRRLAHLQPLREGGTEPCPHGSAGGHGVGFHNQHQEIQFRPDPDPSLLGGAAGSKGRQSDPISGQSRKHDSLCPRPDGCDSGSSHCLAEGPGSHGQHGRLGPILSLSNETGPTPCPGTLQTEFAPCVSTNPDDGASQDEVVLVDDTGQLEQGGHISSATRNPCDHDRCLQERMGRSHGGADLFRPLVGQGGKLPYQSPGALGSGENLPGVAGVDCGQQGHDTVRQFDCRIIPEQTGRNKITYPLSSHTSISRLVSTETDLSSGGTHCWGYEHSGGRSIQGAGVQSDRVDTESPGRPRDFPEIVLPNNRPVCSSVKPPVARLLCKAKRSKGIRGRRSVSQLGGHDSLRFSANISADQGGQQDSGGRLQRSADRPFLAPSPLVSAYGGSTHGRSTAPSTISRPPPDAGETRDGHGRSSSSSDCMAIIRQRCQEDGFSVRAAELISGGRRDSTLRTYSARLAPYWDWCEKKGCSPTRAPVAQIAEFLTERFDSGLESNTVRNYKSAIQAVHRGFADGTSLKDDKSIRLLLDGMFNSRPPARKIVPAWDLNVVLNYLAGSPFEPMRSATLRDTTLKTVFLVALASGCRQSELHALSVSATVFSRSGLTTNFRPGFLAKNERNNFSHAPLTLPRIGTVSSVREDRVWCPVRAVDCYLDKTANIRKGNDQLFLTHKDPHKPAAKQTLARWLVSVIVGAKAVTGSDRPSAHSTRAIASSWAFQRGISVSEICNAVSWKSQSTFTSVYMKDVQSTANTRFARAVLSKSSGGQR